MAWFNIAFVGFGNVGRALAALLQEKEQVVRERYGIKWRLTGVASRRIGWRIDPAGLDVDALLADGSSGRTLPACAGVREWLAAARADVLMEMSSVVPASGEPAISYLRAALEHGAHAITANKGAVVHGYRALRDLAEARGRGFRFEATVMAGAPIFSLFRETLPAVRLLALRGVLNSTTNLILASMEAGLSLEEAVAEAQALGITETDPGLDIDGWDAAVKVAALVTVLMDTPIRLDQMAREGIRGLSREEVRAARAAGTPYKLVCWAERRGDEVAAGVRPERLPLADPLARADGVTSVVRFDTDTLSLTVSEDDPTVRTTAYGMLADFIGLVSR
jgi:homoserine dehydrogenase